MDRTHGVVISLLLAGLLGVMPAANGEPLGHVVSSNTTVVQADTVRGTVTDASDQTPLPGVNIRIGDTSQGAVTDLNGRYTLFTPTGADSLIFSFVGYETARVPIQGRSEIDVQLTPVTYVGDEVVVVGYGTQRAINLTGSLTSVNSEELQDIPVPNTSALLQGKMSGVTVSNFAPQPGRDDAEIRIRGIGTFNAGQSPLVVIDGVPSEISTLSQISPSDIEDVTVLKDAASAAIYGARAANGVILVQTAQGASEQAPRVTLRSTYTHQTPLLDIDLLDSWDYARVVNEWEVAEGGEPLYTEEQIQMMRDGSDPDRFANTDWYSEVVNPAPMQEYYLSVSGGTGSTQYMVSTEYNNQEGIMEGTSAEQFGLRSNVNVDVSGKARVSMNLFGYRQTIDQPALVSAGGSGDFNEQAVTYIVRRFAKPTIPVKYSNGEWGTVDGLYPNWGFPIGNPVQLVHLGENTEDQYHVTANLSGQLSLMPDLTVESRVSGQYDSRVWTRFMPTNASYDWEGNMIGEDPTNSLDNDNHTSYKLVNTNLVTYEPQFGRHDVTLLGGQSTEYFRHDYFLAHAEGFPNNNLRELGAGVENLDVNGWAQDYGLFSLFGRAGYRYDSRYLFEANVRYDGSSRFAEGNRFAFFPSFSAGWVISSESFMQDVDAISFLKLRASWGRLGNQEIGNYPYAQTYAADQNYLIGGNLVGGAAITELANEEISWETTTMVDVGVDLSLLDSRIDITADYFDKRTSDILMRLPIPDNQGNVAAPYQNIGEVQNKGWELSLDYNHAFSENFGVEAGFNVSHIENEVLDLGEMGDNELGGWISGNTLIVEGQPIGAYYGYVAEGFFQSQEEVDNHATQFGDLGPGDIKFKDLNDDGVIDPENDRTVIGQPFPEYTFGVNFGANYRQFDLNAFLQGLYGIERFNYMNNELTADASFTTRILDHWTEDNRDADFPRFGNWTNNNQHSSFWLENASYLRLKQLQLGYTLPPDLTQRFAVNRLRLYVAGYNLLTVTEMEEVDPEKVASDQRNMGYPGTKNYAIGLSLTF